MSTLSIARQGVYWTIQGEGVFSGEPMLFLRLAGCSVGCPMCDTNYVSYKEVDSQDIVAQCERLREINRNAAYVWVTGGEPTDQPLTDLNRQLWGAGFKPVLATSGVRAVEDRWWWVSVSPHNRAFVQRIGGEMKLVPGLNGLSLADMEIIDSSADFAHYFVQPMVGSRESLEVCLEWLRDHPRYRMSAQSHKSWGLA